MASRLKRVGMALIIGALIAFTENMAAVLVTGRTPFADGSLGFIDTPKVAVAHLAIASIPMLMLAVSGVTRRWPWAIAILLPSLFAIFAVHQFWRDSLGDFAGGANIGLGLIMMASPFLTLGVIGCIALAGYAARRIRRRRVQ
ncbi:MAG: hypothetical protein AB7E60_14555 [Sphingobium sp.]